MAALLSRIKSIFVSKNGSNNSSSYSLPITSRGPQLPSLQKYKLEHFDRGVFAAELAKLLITPQPKALIGNGKSLQQDEAKLGEVHDGTVVGTQLALNEMMNMIESSFTTFFTASGMESIFPISMDLEKKRKLYTWTQIEDHYPPHCAMIPKDQEKSLLEIFDALAILSVRGLLKRVVPNGSFIDKAYDDLRFNVFNKNPSKEKTMAGVEEFNREQRKNRAAAYAEKNIGDRAEWYMDAVFAQQFFTGTNPVNIQQCPDDLFNEFKEAAGAQQLPKISSLLTTADRKSLYVLDHRYYRKAMGFAEDAVMTYSTNAEDVRYHVASVALFQLGTDGILHPLGIVIDYKTSMAKSVVIFNKRTKPTDSKSSEKTDWPWRYAKTCVMVSDWFRHELATHLNNTHFIEEAVIVATQRSIEPTSPVFRILSPHWFKTLSLNAAARSTLVPDVIIDLVGVSPEKAQAYLMYEYTNFNWTQNYVPADLNRRGFPIDKINVESKYKKYGYGRNIINSWDTIRSFVSDMLKVGNKYPTDAAVAADQQLDTWCAEMRSPTGGRLSSFPSKIATIAALTDALTMCIHIASPQHTAVNYLQQYYQSFVPNRPAALYTAPPTTLVALSAFQEQDLVAALPIHRPREYLLSSHVPWLLSFRVNEKQSIAAYAKSLHATNAARPSSDTEAMMIKEAAGKFYEGLRVFERGMYEISAQMDGELVYAVLDPDENAVSILI